MNRRLPGLFLAAWAIHDLEECLTIPSWSRRNCVAESPRALRVLPWLRRPVSARHQNTAVATMGVLVAAAAITGARTRGSSPAYRAMTIAYGVHGLSHLGASVVLRGYTPGVITTPLTVVPYALWAECLARATYGPLPRKAYVWAALALPISLALSHGVANLARRIIPAREQPALDDFGTAGIDAVAG